MFNLSPKNDKFFDLFSEFAEIIEEAAKTLNELVEKPEQNAVHKFEELRDIEHKGDKKLHEVLEEINNSFITPLDREDLYVIGKALDDVVDNIEETGGRFMMYNVAHSRENAKKFSQFIVQASVELKKLMVELAKMKNSKEFSNLIIEINKIENQGDVLFRESIRELFDGKTKEIDIIIWKDIYEVLEKTADSFEKLANIIEGVVMKHA
ncbi:hypothetical protein SAMN02745163_02374 [Clostridium cavendishii DSM 21758]|uniref:Phosphate transport regulator n=1 Tax=Clostridium cavendishii DSM 21758 TaxID=1121302 RepID=A0A1M6LGD2_9CLOT|nr:DUF47 family protein [Clostridium cavendishii]SHJ70252.1 hypothetical protein SAMN02745163_02374 [Clostridium cavendishii DSM 21758]